MFGCERCGSKFSSARAATIRNCPRCLLRDDVASPLTLNFGKSWSPGSSAGDPTGVPGPGDGPALASLARPESSPPDSEGPAAT
jgi:hypothetical protein